jgi:hypothetical protein
MPRARTIRLTPAFVGEVERVDQRACVRACVRADDYRPLIEATVRITGNYSRRRPPHSRRQAFANRTVGGRSNKCSFLHPIVQVKLHQTNRILLPLPTR